ncbi:ZIP family metal transporter [Flavobacteriaceae bacterium R38]|nr:ZIP family metal transporter [Flavobacteriaceae bacterium R38]
MINYFLPILAVLIGFLIVLIIRPKQQHYFKLFLAFSGAFLLSLTIFELLPDVFEHSDGKHNGIFIMLGISLQIFLEFFSRGAEHGHVHTHSNNKIFPWLLFTSLSIHSFLEGFPVNHHDSLIFAIVIHKTAIAIILSSFLLESKMSKKKIAFFLILFSLMTPLGSYASDIIPMDNIRQHEISAIVVGIFLHISTTILFETSEGHQFNIKKLLVIIAGLFTAYLI